MWGRDASWSLDLGLITRQGWGWGYFTWNGISFFLSAAEDVCVCDPRVLEVSYTNGNLGLRGGRDWRLSLIHI